MSANDLGPALEVPPELLAVLEEGVLLHGPDGSVHGCTAAAERILGLAATQVVGRRGVFSSLEAVGENGVLLTPDSEPARVALRLRAPTAPRRVRIRRPDGEPAWLRVRAAPLMRPATAAPRERILAGALTVLQDLSEQVLDEERLSGLVPEDAFSRLAGSVAHDFNHFLTVILGHAELLHESLPPSHALREHAEQMRDAALRASTLTRELLDFSRRHRRAAGPVDLAVTIGAMRPMLTRLMGPAVRVGLELEREGSLVRANAAQLERVILNLAFNARDAMRAGGELRLATEPVEIDEAFVHAHPGAQVGHFVRLTVTDDGVGMDARTRERLFEPFFTTKAPGRGTGLGLATVYGIVKQFGGFIEVDSEPGVGTSFRIDLPAFTGTVAAAAGDRVAERAESPPA